MGLGALGANLSTRPSDGTPSLFIVTGLAYLVATLAVLGSDLAVLTGHYRHNPTLLMAAHLFVLGFGTMVTMGALIQMVPVILGEAMPSSKSTRIAYAHMAAGVALMVLGFGLGSFVSLAAGGALVTGGCAVFALHYGRALLQSASQEPTRPYMIAALAALVLTVAFGVLMAIQLHRPIHPVLTLRGLPMHILLGGVGWFTVMIVGVSYKLIPMFATAPGDVTARARRTFFLLEGGLVLLAIAWLPAWQVGVAAGALVLSLGLLAYAWDVAWILRRRLRRSLGGGMGLAVSSVLYLLGALVVSLSLAMSAWQGEIVSYRWIMAAALLFLGGWIGAMILGMLAKIVPMIVWLDRYSDAVGRRNVPTIQELLNDRAIRIGNLFFHAGLIVVAGGVATAWAIGATAGAAILATGVLIHVVTLATVWRHRSSGATGNVEPAGHSATVTQ